MDIRVIFLLQLFMQVIVLLLVFLLVFPSLWASFKMRRSGRTVQYWLERGSLRVLVSFTKEETLSLANPKAGYEPRLKKPVLPKIHSMDRSCSPEGFTPRFSELSKFLTGSNDVVQDGVRVVKRGKRVPL